MLFFPLSRRERGGAVRGAANPSIPAQRNGWHGQREASPMSCVRLGTAFLPPGPACAAGQVLYSGSDMRRSTITLGLTW